METVIGEWRCQSAVKFRGQQQYFVGGQVKAIQCHQSVPSLIYSHDTLCLFFSRHHLHVCREIIIDCYRQKSAICFFLCETSFMKKSFLNRFAINLINRVSYEARFYDICIITVHNLYARKKPISMYFKFILLLTLGDVPKINMNKRESG